MGSGPEAVRRVSAPADDIEAAPTAGGSRDQIDHSPRFVAGIAASLNVVEMMAEYRLELGQ